MLYHLFEYLKSTGSDFAGIGLMQYISFRVVCCIVVAILTSMVVGKRIIRILQKKQIGEEIRDLGLEGQMSKKGTPTMGGVIIILSILIPILLFGNFSNINTILLVVATLWLGMLGFADDYIKVFKHNKDGMSGRHKILGQVVLGLVVGLAISFSPQCVIRDNVKSADKEAISETTVQEEIPINNFHSSNIKTTIPFVKNNELDYSWFSPFEGRLGDIFTNILYVLVIIFIITACSNGSNLTDGLDGLNSGVSAIIGVTLGILAYLSGHIGYAGYLNIMYLPNSGEITVYMAAFVGAIVGFLWYNSFPAQVFMGDTGSLALGGIIGVCAVLIRKELLLPILCGIFLVESLSVLLQRYYFKYTKKKYGAGKRIFKMAPLHHHFQKEGIEAIIKKPAVAVPEAKIVVRFWIVSLLLAVLTIVTLKIR